MGVHAIEKCYYCGKRAISREHVPPKCIFPDINDANGVDLRKNLISVPSCSKHNSEKSKDDEYLLFLLTANTKTEEFGEQYFIKKVVRSMNHSPRAFASFVRENKRIFIWDKRHGLYTPTIAYSVDLKRFDSIVRHICKGIYYHERIKVFWGDIQILYNGLLLENLDSEINRKYALFDHTVRKLLGPIPYRGDNPEVFKYKFYSEKKEIILYLVFFAGFSLTIKLTEKQ